MLRVSVIVLLMTLFVLFSSPGQTVDLVLNVADGVSAPRALHFGLAPTASDGLDASLAETELPPLPPTGAFDARLIGYDIGIDLGQGSLRDFRKGDSTTTGRRIHEITYQVGGGSTVTLSWNLPQGIQGRLQDIITGGIVDQLMTGTGSFTINNPGVISKLKLTVGYGGVPAAVEENSGRPMAFGLEQNYPNPFNPRTEVRSQMAEARHVKLAVYDMLGREVAVLVDERRAAGSYQDTFDGSGLASGVYLYRLTAGASMQSKRMTLLK